MRSFGPSPVLLFCSAAFAVLLLATLPVLAQEIIDVNSDDFNGDLLLAYESASDGDTLLLGLLPTEDDDDEGENGDSEAQRIQTYILSDTLLLDKSVTIRGDSALLPNLIVVQYAGALDGPVIEVDEGVTVRLEGFAITGGTSGVLGRVDANISINRCYIHRNAEAGVELNNIGSATITNSSIVNNGIYGLRVLGDLDAAIGNVEVGQSTFIGNGSDYAFDEAPTTQCALMIESITQWEDFIADGTYGAGANSLESAGIPVSYLLALVQEVVCERFDAELASSVHQTTLSNRALLRAESTIINEDAVLEGEAPISVGEALGPYEDAIAVALSLDTSLRQDLISLLDGNGLSLTASYTVVECEFVDADEDADADEGEGDWVCSDSLGNPVTPFSGGGDIDRDELTNAQEYNNVVGNGGREQAFARAATDPLRDGSEITVMPDTVGASLMEALNLLAAAGLGPVTVSRRIDDAPFGEVIEQRPDANEPLLEGTPVHLVVSNKESGAAIMTAAGGTMVYASLFHRNARGIDHQGGDAVSSWGNFFSNNDEEDTRGEVTLEVEAPDVQVVSLASGSWIGKLDTFIPIVSGLDADDYPDSLAGNNLDFERDPRAGDIIQVGADEVNAALGLSWLNCTISPDPAGLADRVLILIELGTGLTASSVDILIRPETLLPGTAEGSPELMLEMDELVVLDSLTLQGYLTIRDGLIPDDSGFILDGRAQVYLLGAGELYGVGTTNELYMAPGAIEGSNFLIDITPPIILGGIRANQFIINSNDTILAPVSNYPNNWVPAYEATPASGVQLANQEDSQGEPQIFFNLKNAEPYPVDTFPLLNFDVVVTFEDRPPEGYPNIEIAGFENVRLSEETFLAVAFAGGESQLMLSGVDVLQPNPADFVQVGGFTTGVSDAGYPTLSITWQFRDLNYLRAEDALYNNDWRLTGQFRVVSSQGNITTRSNRFHMWWMHRARAQITSSKYEGRRTDNPSFTWGLARGGRSPQNAFPAFPIALFQIFIWNGSAWSPVAGPSPWIADRTIDRFTVIDAGSEMRLGDLLQNFPTGQFRISIIGADEAGNVQIPNADWNNNVDMDYWENEPESTSIDTNIQGRFWYFDDDGVLPNRELGPVTRIMLPNCDLTMRITGEFLLRAVATEQRIDEIAWRFYRNGVLINDGVINGVQGILNLIDLIGEDEIWDMCQIISETSTTVRSQEFVLEAAGVSGTEMDPNPASYRFQVIADLPLHEDQPIKETVRE